MFPMGPGSMGVGEDGRGSTSGETIHRNTGTPSVKIVITRVSLLR